LQILTLASGSQGNAILIKSGKRSLLIDFGISLRKFKIRLSELDEELNSLDAIFLSHEHSDHIRGLQHLSGKIHAPVFATEGTWDRLSWLNWDAKERFKCGEKIRLNGFDVQAFRVPHDAEEPVGFVIEAEGKRLGIATDLGSVNGLVRERLKGVELVILESNHDPEMLLSGPYPWDLKQRILGRKGHLSNQDCASLLTELQHYGLNKAVLAHLSEENNTPELAYSTSRELLEPNIDLFVTSQRKAGPKIEF